MLRRFELEGTDTLPPVGDSVQALAPPAEDFAIDMGDVPSIDGVAAPRARQKVARSGWNYAAWAMAGVLVVVLAMFALLQPITLDLKPGDANVSSVGAFSWQSASSVFVWPGEHTLRAEREGYEPAVVRVQVGGPTPARALIHLVKLPGKLQVDSGGVAAQISADGAALGKVPGTVSVPAGERTLTFKAPRYLDHVERLTIAGGGELQKLKVALKPNFGVVSVSSVPDGRADRSRRQGRSASRPRRLKWIPACGACRSPRRACASGPRASSFPRGAGQHRPHQARRRGRARHRALGAVGCAGHHRRQLPWHHAGHHRTVARRVARRHRHARGLCALDARNVRRRPDQAATLDARLAALLVEVRIQGTPADAEVFVNGESRGKAPVSVSLPASRHRLEVRREGYNPFATDLVLAPGIARTHRFQAGESARMSRAIRRRRSPPSRASNY